MNPTDLKQDASRPSAFSPPSLHAVTAVAAQRLGALADRALGVAARIDEKLVNHAVTLPPAIDAERKTMRTRAGQEISYYVDRHGTGRPLLFIHSVNAAASAYEVKPLFERYRGKRPVYAMDLPGFGFSERDARPYTPHLFAGAIEDLLARIEDQHHGTPADVVALSLAGEFVARAALEKKGRIHSLVLVSPTGLSKKSKPKANATLQRLFALEPVGQVVFDALVSAPSMAFFLRQSFAGAVDEGFRAYAMAASHQPGARYAPLAFVSGALFTPNALDELYAKLDVPTLVLHDRVPYVGFDALPDLVARAPRVRTERIADSRGLPQFDRPDLTGAALERFWSTAEHGQN